MTTQFGQQSRRRALKRRRPIGELNGGGHFTRHVSENPGHKRTKGYYELRKSVGYRRK